MAKNFTFVIRSNTDEQPWISGAKNYSLNRLINYLASVLGGARSGAVTIEARNTAVAATGTVTLSSSSGTVGATINGVSVTTAFATSDTVTAAALAAAINASGSALVNKHVTATSALGVVTVTAVHPGYAGNAVTLAASGTGATASGARLTGGSSDAVDTLTF
jgi:phage tail sheath gpL-like